MSSQLKCDYCANMHFRSECNDPTCVDCSYKDDDSRDMVNVFKFLSTISPVTVTRTCNRCMAVTVTTMNHGIEKKAPVMEAHQRSAKVATSKKDGSDAEPKRGRQQSTAGEADGSHNGVSGEDSVPPAETASSSANRV